MSNDGADITGPGRRGAGVYAWDTRHLSTYAVTPRLRPLSAEVLPDGAVLTYRRGPFAIERRIRLDTRVTDGWTIENRGAQSATFTAQLAVDADFRDLFEVRRVTRITHGHRAPPRASGQVVRFAYTAADGIESATEIDAPVAWDASESPARGEIRVEVPPHDRRTFTVTIEVRSPLPAPDRAPRDWDAWGDSATKFASDSPALDAWIARSSLDLFLLSDRTTDGFFPSAGIPWFVAPFGRDSVLTAIATLPLRRDLAPAVLRLLADHQGTTDNAQRDEEPGRIPHEIRQGEIVRTGGAFGTPYYGSVDATPLFVLLAAEAARWLPERNIVDEFDTNIRAALAWIDERGDRDGDGFVEYQRKARTGIQNQVWKDSGDSVLDKNGRNPPTPIAAVEVQAYVIAAKRSLAEVVAKRDRAWSARLAREAAELQTRFERAFWMADRGFYAQALDRDKRLIPDIVSNAGHVLWAGAATRAHGRATARRLRRSDLASGWGIRTRSSRSQRYDPRSYQNGAVWPHDTAIAAAGMARYGETPAAARTIAEMIDAAAAFADWRIPELFGGDARRRGRPPVPYPVACVPQAWSAAATFLCVRTILGLEVSADGHAVTLAPLLPDGVGRFEARGLDVGTGTVDVRIERAGARARVVDIQASRVKASTR